jgi:hypothetical protein
MGWSSLSTDAHRASVAEAVLLLVTTPERAAAIVGDLVEGEDVRAGWRFWADLSSVALAFFFRGFSAAPLRSLWFLAVGFVLWFVIYLLLRIAGAAAGLQPLDIGLLDCGRLSGLAFVYLAVTLALSNFLAGAALSFASRAEGLNGCTPLAMFWAVSALVLPILDWASASGSSDCTVLYLTALPFLYVAPLLFGGALMRGARAAAG